MSPGLLLKGGRVIDPASGLDAVRDVLIQDGRVARIAEGLTPLEGIRTLDARRWVLAPGLVDLHTHLREPGEEYKEDIGSASEAALAGGFTTVCAMPNTHPVNDSRAVTSLILQRAAEVGGVRIHPIGAVTVGLAGEALTEMAELKEAGVVAVSDDGKPVASARIMRRALEYARTFDIPVIQHAEDPELSDGGVVNEGLMSARAGLRGQPRQAEEVMVARDIALVALTGARYHVAHLSTAEALRHVREAKARGLAVTCEVTPHHLSLTDDACASYDTVFKVNPPLRTDSDREALIDALAEGVIDAVATDHAPHSPLEKELPFAEAAFGMLGLETALGVVLELVHAGRIPLAAALERLTWGPARTLRLPCGRLAEGEVADLVCIDLERSWTVEVASLRSKSRNTPFRGRTFKGRAVLTLLGGRPAFDLDGALG